mmetsp:Transcript_40352/g.125792  ORF Transcript_40352/g.125792 Transcript_40352/m.125792 type:complete len:431 (-) Transcript_40352:34-1326(-)
MARDRSRSPFEMSSTYEEIGKLVVMREQARYSKDWTLADNIRDKIRAYGVTLNDKTNSWKTSDGQTGRIPTWSEIEAGHTPESIMAAQEMRASGMSTSDGTEPHIKRLVQMREQARAQKDWAQSDKLREELRALGVEISDRDKMWKSASGAAGVIIGYRGAGGPSDLEISTLVVQREKARHSGDYVTSDMIRNELRAVGVEINDREKVWRSSAGRHGNIPTRGGNQQSGTAATQAVAVPQAGAVPTLTLGPAAVAAPATVQGSTASLQNQVIQAALAAAQDPANAARTLQLLQQASAGVAPAVAPGVAPVMAPGVAPGVAPVQALVAPQQTLMALPAPVAATPSKPTPECQEAVDFVHSCQATGRSPMDAEIDWLVGLREKFRQAKDFVSADALRNSMRNVLSIQIHEKEKKWVAADGREGVIPMWNTLV